MTPPPGELTSGQRGIPEQMTDAKEFVVFQDISSVEQTGCSSPCSPLCIQCGKCTPCQPCDEPDPGECDNCTPCDEPPNIKP